jgi:hypothetical protein
VEKNMKKCLIIALFFALFAVGCFDDDSSTDPSYSLSLSVVTTDITLDGVQPGDGKIWAFLYEKDQLDNTTPRNNIVYEGSTDGAVVANTPAEITITDIEPGEYHLVVLFDYRAHNLDKIGNSDKYSLYDGKKNPGEGPAVIDLISDDFIIPGDITVNVYSVGKDAAWAL